MICVNIHSEDGGVQPYWQGAEAPITLNVNPEGVSLTFADEMSGQEVELHFHPSMIKILQGWIDTQPKHTFMAKEGKDEMIADMEAFDKEWNAQQAEASRLAASKRDGVEYPF